jgi:hypothetical protein
VIPVGEDSTGAQEPDVDPEGEPDADPEGEPDAETQDPPETPVPGEETELNQPTSADSSGSEDSEGHEQ